jgi:hypothetical protein
METLIAIIILGFCVWMMVRHPIESLSFVFKVGLLLVLGFIAWFALYCFMFASM